MANKVQTIKIDSILGGTSPTSHFSSPDQFRASIGIDPSLPIDDSTSSVYSQNASGLIRPVGSSEFTISATNVTASPGTMANDGVPVVADSYSESNQNTQDTTYILDGLGQSFTGDGGSIASVKFYLKKTGSPVGNATAKIYAHSGTFGTSSVPTGSALATSDNFDVSTLTASFQLVSFTFTGAQKITLAGGTKYVVTFEFPKNAVNYVVSGADNTSPTHSGNLCELDTGVWNAYSGYDRCFYVYTDSVGTVPWTDPDNAKTSNNVYASTYDAVDASIVDSEVRIVKADGTIGTTNKADTSTVWPDAGADAYASYGSSSDLWGETWTYSDINDADFGVVISAGDGVFTHYLKATNFGFSIPAGATITGIKAEIEKSKDGFGGGRVDHIRITVYYIDTSTLTFQSAPLWMVPNPKTSSIYVLDALGSAYTINSTLSSATAISDAGELSNGLGNGCEYYDNYIYFGKNTTIARLGPLDGSTTLNGDYWGTTLSKTALTHTTYPTSYKNSILFPNHFLKRHSDGKLYIADVVGNTGTIHYIQTTKTTVEGDTNNGSKYDAVHVGYGLWPTAMESYGEELAIAFYEGSNVSVKQARAKLAFWDTTSTNVNKMVWVEFPDQIITALKNVNGILYCISGDVGAKGFRITRFLGGYTFEEIFYSETGEACLPGSAEAFLNQFIFGTHTTIPESDGCLYSVGLRKEVLGKGVFNIMRAIGGTGSTSVTSVLTTYDSTLQRNSPIIGWTQAGDGSTGVLHGVNKQGTTYSTAPSVWWSSLYRVGARFKITRIRIPLAQAVASGMTLVPKIYIDDGISSTTLTTIDYTSYPDTRFVTIQPSSLVGQNNFWLELKWTGTALLTVSLPIEIDFEIIPE